MTKVLHRVTFLFYLLFAFSSQAQKTNEQLITDFFKLNRAQYNLSESIANSFEITRTIENKEKGITTMYVVQTLNGLPVINGTGVFVRKADQLILSGNRLISGTFPIISKSNNRPINLVLSSIWEELTGETGIVLPNATAVSENKFTLRDNRLSTVEIPATLSYYFDGETLRLVYETSLKIPKETNWWNIYADASTGEILKKINWIVSCSFDGCSAEKHFNYNDLKQPDMAHSLMMAPPPPQTDAYRVFEIPIESPNHGVRTLAVGPFDPLASPYGWHDNNGIPGADFTITRGNNVYASEDTNDDNIPGFSPDGGNGASLIFDFPFNGGAPSSYQSAAITNLFYMNNVMHDIWYHYGFTEAAGNFQDNNYDRGGQDDDFVFADAQDGSGTNNANFGTPPDGSNPRMQMFIWTASQTNDLLTINSPAVLAGDYASRIGSFGPAPTAVPITEDLVLAISNGSNANGACDPLTNAAALNGKIAVVIRGGCTFAQKVENCQSAGALAVIVINNVNAAPITMGGSSSIVTIPSIMISQADGNSIINAMNTGTVVNGTIIDSLGLLATDSDMDNVIIAHEYGHGISNRLTGGGNNVSCLGNEDQMGEGWSDWFGLMLTIEPGDLAADRRGVGTYVTGASVTGTGIRPTAYSTSFAINNSTYARTNSTAISQPHGIGYVWATMLWDLNWAFIDEYGFDADMYSGTGGNNKVMELVMEGMKLQPCSPGMVDGRDAILLADQLLNNGDNTCLIWRVFARRGLGENADQGNTDDRFDQVENFTVPASCFLGFEEGEYSSRLLIYPNPSQSDLTISNLDNSLLSSIRILDLNGREIRSWNRIDSASKTIDISEFTTGIYLVEVTNENNLSVIRKISKE